MSQSADRPFTPEQSVAGSSMELQSIIDGLIGKIYTATLVRVESVGGDDYSYDSLAPVGYLDAVSLIQQLDGKNEGIPNEPMYRLPYFRLQGGANAVICDPVAGDIGLAVFAMRDISNIKDIGEEEAPPSRRQYDVSDGLYIGGFINAEPSQFIHFLESGINIVSTGDVNLDTPENINITCSNFSLVCNNLAIECAEDASLTAANIIMDSDGSIAMTASDMGITSSSLNVDCPATVFSGDISAANISSSGFISDGTGQMGNLRDAYNAHTHISADPGTPTGGTSEEV